MNLTDFDYDLPKNFIANRPLKDREAANLMVIDRSNGTFRSTKVGELVNVLKEGDVLVFNDTKVFPARLFGKKKSGGKIELLLTRKSGNEWESMHRGSVKLGDVIIFDDLKAVVAGKESGVIKIRFSMDEDNFDQWLVKNGQTPLPPYIKSGMSEEEARREYQTVYAKHRGSVAAPTAGFHFDETLINKLKKIGIMTEFVTLHVGMGTFLGVKSERIEDHKMHSEWYELKRETAERLNKFKKEGRRMVAVGTTATRVLESSVNGSGELVEGSGETKIFIYPPYKFKFVDGLITNFHLPKSTLLMLVSAFIDWPNGREKLVSFPTSLLGKVYEEAKRHKYRFFSFGDAMFIS